MTKTFLKELNNQTLNVIFNNVYHSNSFGILYLNKFNYSQLCLPLNRNGILYFPFSIYSPTSKFNNIIIFNPQISNFYQINVILKIVIIESKLIYMYTKIK